MLKIPSRIENLSCNVLKLICFENAELISFETNADIS